MKKWKKRLIIILVLILVLAIAAVVFIRIRKSKQTSTHVEAPKTTSLKTGELDERVTASGTVQPTDEKSIFIELSQTVDQVYAEVGDKVEEGQLLVTYDIADDKKQLEDKVKSAQISLSNANIELSSLSQSADGTKLIDLKSAVSTAQKALDDSNKSYTDNETDITDAKKDVDYDEQMLALGGVSQSDYDDAVKKYNDLVNNRATLKSAISNNELTLEKAQLALSNGQSPLNDTSTKESYEKQKNTVASAQMALEEAQTNLSKLSEATYSPIAGTITQSSAVAGQMLTDSTAIMKIADLTQLDVLAYVSEYDISKVAVGQEVELTTDGIEGVTYHGHVTKIEPSAQSQSTISGSETVVPVLVHMDDNDDLIKPGFAFDMEIIVKDVSDANYVPVSSVMKDSTNSTYYVFKVGSDNKLKKTTVEIGVTNDSYMQVTSGLEASDVILESPDSSTKDGADLMNYATTVKSSATSSSSSSGGLLDGLLGGGGGGAPSGGGPGGGGGGMPSGGGPSGGGGTTHTSGTTKAN